MTDAMGLTEPGKKPQRPSSGVLLFFDSPMVRIDRGLVSIHLQWILGRNPHLCRAERLVLAIANYVMWRQSKKGSNPDHIEARFLN